MSGVRYAGKGKRKGKKERKKGRCPVRSAGKQRLKVLSQISALFLCGYDEEKLMQEARTKTERDASLGLKRK